MQPKTIKRIVDDLGGATQLASRLKSNKRRGKTLTKQAVSMWKRIPAEHVLELEQLSGGKYTRHQLRPDIFGRAA